jgi:hypothetical protein
MRISSDRLGAEKDGPLITMQDHILSATFEGPASGSGEATTFEGPASGSGEAEKTVSMGSGKMQTKGLTRSEQPLAVYGIGVYLFSKRNRDHRR